MTNTITQLTPESGRVVRADNFDNTIGKVDLIHVVRDTVARHTGFGPGLRDTKEVVDRFMNDVNALSRSTAGLVQTRAAFDSLNARDRQMFVQQLRDEGLF